MGCINGPLAQSVERGANNAKVMSSRLIRTRFPFLYGLLSLCTALKMLICINGPLAQSTERGASNA